MDASKLANMHTARQSVDVTRPATADLNSFMRGKSLALQICDAIWFIRELKLAGLILRRTSNESILETIPR